MKFIVQDYGDQEVGIFGMYAEVHFNDEMKEDFWTEDTIKEAKDFLKEFYEANNCYTEKEWDEMNAYMNPIDEDEDE